MPELRPTYPIHTERLLLRPLTVADADALLAYRSQPGVARYVPFEPMTHDEILERIAGPWAQTELTDEGRALTLGVELAATGQLAGDVVLFWHSREHAGGEIGYVLHPDFGGRGYATEAARALLGLAFEHLGLHRVIARVDERNTASAQVWRNDTREPAKSTAAKNKMYDGFTDEERSAMKQRAQEVKAAGRRGSAADQADLEPEVLANIAEMRGPDRGMAEWVHEIIWASAPVRSPGLWYGMPAYA